MAPGLAPVAPSGGEEGYLWHFEINEPSRYASAPATRALSRGGLGVRLAGDVDYYTKNHAEEVARTESRNAWVAALRASL